MTLSLKPPEHIGDIEAAKARWEAAIAAERPIIYRTEVFPFAAARLLAERDNHPTSQLLVVPVGTQPYAPLLAALATPARFVAFLASSETRSYAVEVAEALDTLPANIRPATSLFPIGEANSGIDVCRAVDAALFWAGDPWPSEVVLDVTGGRKATSAALGAVAGLRGFRQVYIESQQPRGKEGLFLEERLLFLDDIRAWLQEDERTTATALFTAGAFSAAAAHFSRLAERVLAGPALGWMQQFAMVASNPDPAARKEQFSHLRDAVPAGPIRCAMDSVAESGEACAADAESLVRALLEEGAWR